MAQLRREQKDRARDVYGCAIIGMATAARHNQAAQKSHELDRDGNSSSDQRKPACPLMASIVKKSFQ